MRRSTANLQIFIAFISISFAFQSCKLDSKTVQQRLENSIDSLVVDPNQDLDETKGTDAFNELKPYRKDGWIELSNKDGFAIEIRYATTNNFTNSQIYDCPRCLLREEVATSLSLLNQHLVEKYNLRIKLFDCYRPKAYQQRLWDKVPDPSYVTPPSKGSMHTRGMAVDLTLVDSLGNELDMGTEYDFFGKEAHFDYTAHDAKIIERRQFLRKKMEDYGFIGIRTEWWHFSYDSGNYDLATFTWTCER
jgi:D-alanyl-D-alanine dipeptidase